MKYDKLLGVVRDSDSNQHNADYVTREELTRTIYSLYEGEILGILETINSCATKENLREVTQTLWDNINLLNQYHCARIETIRFNRYTEIEEEFVYKTDLGSMIKDYTSVIIVVNGFVLESGVDCTVSVSKSVVTVTLRESGINYLNHQNDVVLGIFLLHYIFLPDGLITPPTEFLIE